MPFNVFEHIDVSQYKSASCLNDEIEHMLRHLFTSCCYGNFGDIMAIKFKVEIDRYTLKGKKTQNFQNQKNIHDR